MSMIAHIDCDAFYASCEAVRHPELKGRAICVLSSQDAIVVAKSYAAKAMGINTGMPVWEARKLAPQAVFLAADFRYYGQMSAQLFSILRRYSPDMEIYSIDEAFLDVSGVRRLWQQSFQQLADAMRVQVYREVGITVSVGIASTRTLAKMASEAHKPDGTTVLFDGQLSAFLATLPVQAIPGIGRSRATALQQYGIHSARDVVAAADDLIRRLLDRAGILLQQELAGRSVLPLILQAVLPKSLARTASMGRRTQQRQQLAAYVSYHSMRLVADLVAKQLLTRRIYLFLTLDSCERSGLHVGLDVATNSLKRITAAVGYAFARLFKASTVYRGCGVVATQLSRATATQPNLFGRVDDDRCQSRVMLAVNAINRKYGRQTIMSAASSPLKQCRQAPRFHYPVISAH